MTRERVFGTADAATAAGPTAIDGVAAAETTASAGTAAGGTPVDPGATEASSVPLFASDEAARFREQWVAAQGEFVDGPREAVESADELVAQLMQRLATQFSETRSELEHRWDG